MEEGMEKKNTGKWMKKCVYKMRIKTFRLLIPSSYTPRRNHQRVCYWGMVVCLLLFSWGYMCMFVTFYFPVLLFFFTQINCLGMKIVCNSFVLLFSFGKHCETWYYMYWMFVYVCMYSCQTSEARNNKNITTILLSPSAHIIRMNFLFIILRLFFVFVAAVHI